MDYAELKPAVLAELHPLFALCGVEFPFTIPAIENMYSPLCDIDLRPGITKAWPQGYALNLAFECRKVRACVPVFKETLQCLEVEVFDLYLDFFFGKADIERLFSPALATALLTEFPIEAP